MWIAILKSRKTHHCQEMPCPLDALAFRNVLGFKAELDIADRGAPWKQGILLEDQASIERRAVDRRSIDQNAAARGQCELTQHVDQRRFSAAAWPNDRHELASPYVERNLLKGGERLNRPAPAWARRMVKLLVTFWI
jgi:hypothetical protein